MAEDKEAGTKKCPNCAETIKVEAKVCRFCGARFELSRKGYCSYCHNEVEVDENGKCNVCGKAAIDVRTVSRVVGGGTPQATAGSVSAPAPTVAPPANIPYYTPPGVVSLPVSAAPPGVVTPPGILQSRRSNTPIVFGVLHLLEFAYYLYFLINNIENISNDFWVIMELITIIAGLVALPIAAVFLFMRKKTGYTITFGFAILGMITFLISVIGVCNIVGASYLFQTPVIAMLFAMAVRYLYPYMAAMVLRPRVKIDLS